MSESVHRRAFDAFADLARDRLADSLHQLTLFGSVAHSEEHAGSDVDVFGVVDHPADKQELHDLAFEIEAEFGVAMSLIVRTPEEYEAMEGSRIDRQRQRGMRVV